MAKKTYILWLACKMTSELCLFPYFETKYKRNTRYITRGAKAKHHRGHVFKCKGSTHHRLPGAWSLGLGASSEWPLSLLTRHLQKHLNQADAHTGKPQLNASYLNRSLCFGVSGDRIMRDEIHLTRLINFACHALVCLRFVCVHQVVLSRGFV